MFLFFLDDGDTSVFPIDICQLKVDDITCPEPHFDPRHNHGGPSQFYRSFVQLPVLFDPPGLVFSEDIHKLFSGSTSWIDAQVEIAVLYVTCIFQKNKESPDDPEARTPSAKGSVTVLCAEAIEYIRIELFKSGKITIHKIPA